MATDREEIIDVLTRYATGIDQCDWELFATCWADGAEVRYAQFDHIRDAAALTDLFRQVHDPMGPTYHRLTNFVIDVDGDRATARTYVHAVLMLSPGDENNWVDALGHYDDELVRTENGWRIGKRVSHTARLLTGGQLAAGAKREALGE